MPLENNIINLPGFQVLEVVEKMPLKIEGYFEIEVSCPHCQCEHLRSKDTFWRSVRHESVGTRKCYLKVLSHKYQCLGCKKYFNQRLPGILPWKRSTEQFRKEVFEKHVSGISQQKLHEQLHIGSATVERWSQDYFKRELTEKKNNLCPMVMGIDEHFFTRKQGYATTICDLMRHRVYDVVLGRSEKALEGYLKRLKGRHRVKVVVMDLSQPYRSMVKKYFPNAMIVADRFHVIRLINFLFLKSWQQFDPIGRKNRGLLSLMRRHEFNLKPEQQKNLQRYFKDYPMMKIIYDMKQKLCNLMLNKHRTAKQCRKLIPQFLKKIEQLIVCKIDPLITLGKTLRSWSEEVARMWRFTKTNSITEGLHTKMEMITRRAFGFRNFNNYRLRVIALCG
jgi:transposase